MCIEEKRGTEDLLGLGSPEVETETVSRDLLRKRSLGFGKAVMQVGQGRGKSAILGNVWKREASAQLCRTLAKK